MKVNNNQYINFITSYYFPISLICIVIIINIYMFHSEYLFYEEAQTFFTSQGIDVSSKFFTPPGDVFDVIANNNKYNMDPGGFNILLHLWQKLSLNILWIRLLPIFFFLSFLYFFGKVFYKIFGDIKFSLYVCLIPLFLPMLAPISVRLRAYSMEALGVVLSVFFLIKLYKNISIKNLLCYSIILSILISSRYSLLLLVFIQTNFVIYKIITNKSKFKNKIFQLLAYSIPLIFSVSLIFFFTLINQNPSLNHGHAYMPFLGSDPLSLFKGINLFYSFILITIFYFYYHMRLKINENFKILLIFTLISNTFFILLSLINIHPWSIHAPTRLNVVFILTLLSIICLFYYFTKEYIYNISLTKFSNYFSLLGVFTIIIYFLILDNKMESNWRRNNIISELKKMDQDSRLDFYNNFFIIDPVTYGVIKYIFESDIINNERSLNFNHFKNFHLSRYLYKTKKKLNINKRDFKYYVSNVEAPPGKFIPSMSIKIKNFPGYKYLYEIVN